MLVSTSALSALISAVADSCLMAALTHQVRLRMQWQWQRFIVHNLSDAVSAK